MKNIKQKLLILTMSISFFGGLFAYEKGEAGLYFEGKVILDSEYSQLEGDLANSYDKSRDMYHDFYYIMQMTSIIDENIKIGAEVSFYQDFSEFWGDGETVEVTDIYAEFRLWEFLNMRFGSIYPYFSDLQVKAKETSPLEETLAYGLNLDKEAFLTGVDVSNALSLEGFSWAFAFAGNQLALDSKGFASKLDDKDSSTLGMDRYLLGWHQANTLANHYQFNLLASHLFDHAATSSEGIDTEAKMNTVYEAQVVADLSTVLETMPFIKNITFESDFAQSAYNSNASPLEEEVEGGETNLVLANKDFSQNGIASISTLGFSVGSFFDTRLQYRYIEDDFVSSSAQTRHIEVAKEGKNFSGMDLNSFANDLSYLEPHIYLSRENWSYQGNTLILNEATPNRKGYSGKLSSSYFDFLELDAEAFILSEISPKGLTNQELREFLKIDTVAKTQFDKLQALAFFSLDQTKRFADADEDLSENFLYSSYGLELSYELLKDFNIIALYHQSKVDGFLFVEDYDNQEPLVLSSYSDATFDQTQSLYGLGFHYNYKEVAQIQMDYRYKALEDALDDSLSYDKQDINLLTVFSF